ncbi:MAG: alpha/beta fold hydrolase [Rectinema sp.]
MNIHTVKSAMSLVLAVVLFAAVSACATHHEAGATDNTSDILLSSKDITELEQRTSEYIFQFKNGNFDDFYNECDAQLRQVITESALKSGWDTIVQVTGTPSENVSTTYTRQNGLSVVGQTIEATLYKIRVTITYNADGKPVGIWTTYLPKDPPKPQSTSAWQEFPLTVGEKHLPGMLTLPKGLHKPPVVIMIQGSGPSDMNESVGAAPNRPFEDIAHRLAEGGVATLRYNKRTYQYPFVEGDTIQYEVLDDAAAAVALLSNDSRVDASRIYILGHSLGGMLAPKIAADNPKIKGFISMAGTLRPLQDLVLDQSKAALDADTSLTEDQRSASLGQIKSTAAKVAILDDGGTGFIFGIPTNYWKSLNAIDSVAIVKKLSIPMLILQGGTDFQVYPDKDYTLWQTTLKGRNNVTFHLYGGLSHQFMSHQFSASGAPDISVYDAPNHVSSQVISDIAAWVRAQ